MANRGYVPFIILSSGRSGSNLLVSLLRSDPEVICFGELLNVGADFIDFSAEGYDDYSTEDRTLRDTDVTAFFERRIFCEHGPGIRAVGFKPMYQHLPFFPDLAGWLAAQPDLRVVHSKRRNLLRLLVSLRIAEKTGQWIAPTADERPEHPIWRKALELGMSTARGARRALRRRRPRLAEAKAVTLSPEECQFGFTWLREQADDYAERFRGHPVLDVYYEDLVDATGRTLRQVQDFLHLDPWPLTTATRRQNPEPLRALIVNYDELYEAFRGTEYAQFFDE
jgi:hypothetical protein